MRSVNRFEADLLNVLHAVLGTIPLEVALPAIARHRKRPSCLGRDAVDLVQDALAKGIVRRLAREGSWLPQRHLRGDLVASGRLWDRTPPEELGLTFSAETLAFFVTLTVDQLSDDPPPWSPDVARLTIGDHVVLYFAYQALRTTRAAPTLRGLPQFARNGLCRLAFPDDFAEIHGDAQPDFSPWALAPGAFVLEALQPYLATRWVDVEGRKSRIADPDRMIALGREQQLVLDSVFEALSIAGRYDLARFLLSAFATLLRKIPDARTWVGSLQLADARMARRVEVHRAALVLLRSIDRLSEWERRARTVGYFDDGYAASQLWKSDWESYDGDRLCDVAAAVVRAVEPLSV